MAKLDLAYDIRDYTPAAATPVDNNFVRIEEHINAELIERDGSVAMRGQLQLAGDPVALLDAAPKQYVDQVLPIGIIMMHGGASAPPGGRWRVCNGAEVQTADFPALWAVIGHNFSPDGTPNSRFHLPNLRDRMPMGVGTETTMGEKSGWRDAIVVEHDHGMKNHHHGIGHDHDPFDTSETGNHNHNIVAGAQLIRSAGSGFAAAGTALGAQTHEFDGQHKHTINVPAYTGNSQPPNDNTTGAAGISGTDRNLPPFLGVQFIIRVS